MSYTTWSYRALHAVVLTGVQRTTVEAARRDPFKAIRAHHQTRAVLPRLHVRSCTSQPVATTPAHNIIIHTGSFRAGYEVQGSIL